MKIKMTVAMRLGLGFAALVALFGLMSGAGTWLVVTRASATVDSMYAGVAKGNQHLAEAQNALWTLRFHVSQYIGNPARRKEYLASGPKWAGVFEESLGKYSALRLDESQRKVLKELNEAFAEYKRERPKWFELMEAGKLQEADEHRQRTIIKSGHATVDALAKLIEANTKAGVAIREAGEASIRQIVIGATGVGVLVVGIGCLLGLALVRSITRPLGGEPGEAKAAVQRIAAGDLTADIPLRSGDTDSLLAAMKMMQGNLRRMVSELKANAEGVAGAAQQLVAASDQVAGSSSQQSEAASSMAADVEQMTVSISHVSGSAEEARRVTAETGELSEAGSRVIRETVTEMQGISRTVGETAQAIHTMGEDSQKISGVVQVIRDVAEQTNLLALNAAIEAARAGEQGRGFAVVADEVRKLAERTSQATGEISAMIDTVQASTRAAVAGMEQAVTQVGQGVEMASRASDSMHSISEGAQRVVRAVNEISGALAEQSAASNDISANVDKIARMSEQNSAATREAAETARRLERLAGQTRDAVARFTV